MSFLHLAVIRRLPDARTLFTCLLNLLLVIHLSHLISTISPVLVDAHQTSSSGNDADQRPVPAIPIGGGRSFSVRSTINMFEMTSPQVGTNQMTIRATTYTQAQESYSVEQRRASIVYTTRGSRPRPSSPQTGAFHLEAPESKGADPILVQYSRFEAGCQPVSRDQLKQTLSLNFLDQINPGDMYESPEAEFIVGPARLLLFVAKHRDKLELKSLGVPFLVRNLSARLYTLEVTSTDLVTRLQAGTTRLEVYYSEAELALNQDSASPIQVIIKGLTSVWQVDYSPLEILLPNTPLDDSNNMRLFQGQVNLDQFSFPLFCGCSKSWPQTQTTGLEDLFGQVASSSTRTSRFSFRAKLRYSLAESFRGPQVEVQSDLFVAYDSALNSMRVDVLLPNSEAIRRQVFNFKLNRMYHVFERQANSRSAANRVFDLSRESSLEEEEQGDAITAAAQCVVAKILPPELSRRQQSYLSIGRLLVGADRFALMGRAKVRGVPALVYEAHNVTLPFWLDQPQEFKSPKGESGLRLPETGGDSKGKGGASNLSLLLYVAEQEAEHPLLLLQFYSFLRSKKQTIEFADFSWSLVTEAPNGDRPEELFSLEDLCSAGLGRSHYAKVELLLESIDEPRETDTSTNKALEYGPTRDLALLAAIQRNLELPATMIYDLDSRYLTGSAVSGSINEKSGLKLEQPNRKSAIFASFRLAKHTNRLAELIYLGQGRVKLAYRGQRTTDARRSFQACFFLAAHRRANVYFGFDLSRSVCSIDLEPIYGPVNIIDEQPPSFTMDPEEPMEIYRIQQTMDQPQIYATNSQIDGPTSLWNRYLGQQLSLPFIVMEKNEQEKISSYAGSALYSLTKFQIDDRDFRASTLMPAANQSTKVELPPIRVDRFPGVGLPEEGSDNRAVGPASLRDSNWSPLSAYFQDSSTSMTFDQCLAACLSDFTCRSFSTCLRSGQLRCVISTHSFRSQELASQLSSRPTTSGSVLRERRFKVTVSERETDEKEEIELIEHPTCELYDKNFMDLFEKALNLEQSVHHRRARPVIGAEQCAELCFRQNIAALKEDATQAAKSFTALEQELSGSGSDRSNAELINLLKKHQTSEGQVCRAFIYLDRSKLMGAEEQLVRSRVIDWPKELGEMCAGSEELIQGYCIVGERMNELERQKLIEANMSDPSASRYNMNVQQFWFRMEYFYEKQHGVRLLGATLNSEEYDAYHSVARDAGKATEAAIKTVRSLITLGDNFQTQTYADKSRCARACFLQAFGPWPACRSFGLETELKENKSITYCYLNSITMHQAIETQRFDLIEDSKQFQLVHYEPRAGFVLDESRLNADLQMAEQLIGGDTQSERGVRRLEPLPIGIFGQLLIVLVSTITGLVLGIRLGPKLVRELNWRLSQHQGDGEALISRRPTIVELKDQFNSEEIIYD